jgi:2'-5' RNA ligase
MAESTDSGSPTASHANSKLESKRLFVGIPIVPTESLLAAIKRTKISADKKGMEFYWSPAGNFHLTLFFLGNTETGRLAELERLLAEIASVSAPIKTSLKGMGGFPDLHHLRVLYIGVRKSRSLAETQARVTEMLLAHEFGQPEDREYVPHLTIGRLRKSRSSVDLISPHIRTSFGDVEAGELVLFESVKHGAQPVYIPLGRYPLTGIDAAL